MSKITLLLKLGEWEIPWWKIKIIVINSHLKSWLFNVICIPTIFSFLPFSEYLPTIKLLLNDFMDEKSKVNPLKFQNVKCMTNLNGPKRKKVHYMSFVLVGFHLETITLQFSTLTLYQTTPFLKEMKEALYHDEKILTTLFLM